MLQTRELRTTRRRWGILQNLTNFEFHSWGSVLSMCPCVCVSPLKSAAFSLGFKCCPYLHPCEVAGTSQSCHVRYRDLSSTNHRDTSWQTSVATTKIHGPRRCSNSAAAKILAVRQWKRGNVDWMATLRPITWPWRPELHTFAQPKFEFLEFFERVRESQTFDMICRVMILVRFDGCQIKCCHNFAWGASYSG